MIKLIPILLTLFIFGCQPSFAQGEIMWGNGEEIRDMPFIYQEAESSCITFSGKPKIEICEDGFFVDGEKITRNKTIYYKLKNWIEKVLPTKEEK